MCGLVVCGVRNRRDDGCADRRHGAGAFRRPRLGENRLARHAFLEQQLGRLDPRVGVEPRHEDVVAQHVGERDERHALVVRKKRAHDFRLASPAPSSAASAAGFRGR